MTGGCPTDRAYPHVGSPEFRAGWPECPRLQLQSCSERAADSDRSPNVTTDMPPRHQAISCNIPHLDGSFRVWQTCALVGPIMRRSVFWKKRKAGSVRPDLV